MIFEHMCIVYFSYLLLTLSPHTSADAFLPSNKTLFHFHVFLWLIWFLQYHEWGVIYRSISKLPRATTLKKMPSTTIHWLCLYIMRERWGLMSLTPPWQKVDRLRAQEYNSCDSPERQHSLPSCGSYVLSRPSSAMSLCCAVGVIQVSYWDRHSAVTHQNILTSYEPLR